VVLIARFGYPPGSAHRMCWMAILLFRQQLLGERTTIHRMRARSRDYV